MSTSARACRLGDYVRIRTGKLDANASDPDGAYPFFTCSREPLRIASFSYDCECVLVAGNGDLNVKYYDGKFDAYQRTYIVEPIDKLKLNVRYLFHFMSVYVEQLRLLSIGGVIKYIKLGNLTEASIPLPPLTEQRRIAKALDRAEKLRDKRLSSLSKLDSLSQAIFADLFGYPATNVKRWTRAKLGDVILSASDGPHVSPRYTDGGIPFLSARHVRPGEIYWRDLKFISRHDAELHWKKCKPQIGDILYTKGGTTGLAAVVDSSEPFAIWVHLALLKPDPAKVDSAWLECMLNTDYCFQQSQVLTHGIANRDLGLKRMVNIDIFLPPLNLQQEFASRAATVKKLKSVHRSSLTALDSLFSSLQHSFFRGQASQCSL